MKKIIFSTMIASLLAFVGCQNEELVNETTDNSGKKVTLTAHIAGTANSRVTLNPGTDSDSNPIVNVEWEVSGEKFTVYNSDHSKSAVFKQSEGNEFYCPVDEYNQLGGAKYAYYGYDENRSYDLSSQNGTLDKKCILMEAEVSSSPSNITFLHKTAILKVDFENTQGPIANTSIDKIVLDGANAGSGKEYIKVEPSNLNDIYIFLPIDDTYSSSEKNFMFTVFVGTQNYTGNINIPADRIEAGNLYTATISLQEVNYCKVPWGDRFREYIKPLLNESITGIRFVANSQNMGNALEISDKFPANLKYRYNESTLELHTDADFFVFNYDCSYMFTNMDKIVSIDFGNRINTFALKNMDSMFAGCKMLTNLDLSNFNTENVTSMLEVFKFCESIEILDLSSFNMNSVTKITSMFYGCNNLGDLILSDNFILSSVTQADRVLGRDNNNKKEILIDFKNANANIYTLRMLKSAYPYYNQSILYFNAIVNQYSFEYLSSQNPGDAFLQRLFKREDDGTITPWVQPQ